MDNEFRKLIQLICSENNISCDVLSLGFLLVLEKNGVVKTISGYKFDNNSHSLGKIFDDKYATYELLKHYNVPVCEHSIFYCKNNTNTYVGKYNSLKYLKEKFDEYNGDVVVKKNTGTCGNEVSHFNEFNELEKFYNDTFLNNTSFSICPFYNIGNEYRVIVLNNKVKVMYKKILPEVLGDGYSTIRELLLKFNYEYFKNIDDKSLDVILKKDEKFCYDWKFNLSLGSVASFDISSYDKKNILDIVSKITNNIDIGFCSIDIVKSDTSFLVMEINSGVMMKYLISEKDSGYSIAKDIYTEAILSMFDVK